MLLILLVGAQLSVPRASTAAGASSAAQLGWWNDAYQYRRSLTVSDGGSSPLVNQTVLVHLTFPENDAEDPFSGVRLVNSSGGEVPSVILAPQYSGVFLRSAYLLFLADLQPHSNLTYFVYYGGALQPAPSYRTTSLVSSFGSSLVTAADVALSIDSTRVSIRFGAIDSESIASGVSYVGQSGVQDYGPSTFSRAPFSDDTGMILAGNLSSQTDVAYDALQAGQMQFARIVLVTSLSALTIDAVSNVGSTVTRNVNLTSMVGLDGLSSLGRSQSVYNDTSSLLYTLNPDAYFAVHQSVRPSSFGLGSAADVTNNASTGVFSGVDSYALAASAGFTWDLGNLNPSGVDWVSSAWGVASDMQQIVPSLPAAPLGAVLGQQEVLPTATPSAKSLWSSTVTLTDVPISPSGLVIPFGLGGGTLIPAASTVSGTYSYSVPPSPRLNSNVWTSSNSTTGNATAFASSSYYAFDIGQQAERLTADVPNANSSVTASVISVPGFAFRGSNAVLEVKYKASHGITSGALSDQDLFVSADLDPTLTDNFSESIVLPVSGSSTTIPSSGCDTTGPTAAEPETITPAALLIGDGTWRTLSLSLPSTLPAGGFNVEFRLCLSTSAGFTGTLDLEVASVGVFLSGQASTVLQTSFSDVSPELTIDYLPQALSMASVGTVANLTISEVFMMNASADWQDGATYSGAITAPLALTQNDTSLAEYSTIGSPGLDGVFVGSAVSSFAKSGSIGGVNETASPGPGVAMLGNRGLTNVSSGSQFTLGLSPETVDVAILDQNHVGVPGVQIVPIVNGVTLPVSATTNASGIAPVRLVPWAYQFNATYQGTGIGSAEIQAGAPPSVSLTANIYNLTLIVRDSRGGILPEARVTLSMGSYSLSGTTDSRGRFSFEGIEGALYNITVYVGGNSYSVGQRGATANNVTIDVTTAYLSTSQELLIVLLVAAVPVIVVVGYFVTRRIRRSK